MPEDCLNKRCLECGSHAIVSGKIDCNYMNRLGLAQPTVKTFLNDVPTEKTDAEVENELKQMEEQQRLTTEKLKALQEQKRKMGEAKNASMP